MKNKIIFGVFIIASLFAFSCKKNSQNNKKLSVVTSKIEEDKNDSVKKHEKVAFNGIEPLKVVLKIEANDRLKKLKFSELDLNAEIYAFNEGYSFLRYNDNYFPLEFNYTYDANFENSVNKILFFKSKKIEHIYLILPSYTEEFPTYQILSLSEGPIIDKGLHTLSVVEFEKSLNIQGIDKYVIFENKNDLQLSFFREGIKINFDVIIKNEKVNSKEIDKNDLENIQNFITDN